MVDYGYKIHQKEILMPISLATAIAHPNIALIKYWGNQDPSLRLPANGSISMNLGGLETRTSVAFHSDFQSDCLILNGQSQSGPALERVSAFLNHFRNLSGVNLHAEVESANNFPMGAGIASSASAFAALSLAAASALGLTLSEAQLSRLARLGSGSACRSVPGGFVEWYRGNSDADSFAESIAPPSHWPLTDVIAVVEEQHKAIGSFEGQLSADTSPIQLTRVSSAPNRLDICRKAILQHDFDALARVVELDSNLLHAVMMTSNPPLYYWKPISLQLMEEISSWRSQGLPVCFTLDAGPNVHVICEQSAAQQVTERLSQIPGVIKTLTAHPGGPARLMINH